MILKGRDGSGWFVDDDTGRVTRLKEGVTPERLKGKKKKSYNNAPEW